jgi:transposase
MIPAPTHVWLVVEPIDMRTGIDGLSQRIQNTLGRSPCDGSAYAFHNHRHRGHFIWPRSDATTCTLTAKQWQWLITGVDWQRLEAAPPAHWRV